MNSGHYYQGGHDHNFLQDLPPQFECPICLLCQRDPHQTSCGHRFCLSCLVTWLTEGKTCPHDNTSISLADIFPDTIAHREIQQLAVRCEECELVCSLAEYESHLSRCERRAGEAVTGSSSCPQCGDLLEQEVLTTHRDLVCPNQRVACTFASLGCSQRIQRKDVEVSHWSGSHCYSSLQAHMERNSAHHLQLMSDQLTKVKQILQAERVVAGEAEDSQAQPRLIK